MPNQSEADRAPVLDNFAGYLISAGSWFEYTVVGRRRGELNQSDPEIVNSPLGTSLYCQWVTRWPAKPPLWRGRRITSPGSRQRFHAPISRSEPCRRAEIETCVI